MGFASDNWNLRVNDRIPIAFSIDGFAPRQAVATAINPQQAVVSMPDDPHLFQQMRAGIRMTVTGAGQILVFDLRHTSVVLATLLRCASDRGQSVTVQATAPRPPSDPRPGGEGQAEAARAVTADMRIEATQFVANLLSHADMRGFRILTRSDLDRDNISPFVRASDVAWRGESSFGTLHIHPNIDPRDLDRLSSELIAADSRACSGEFMTGRMADPEMSNVRRLHTFCGRPDGGLETVSYLLLPMPGRLVYQLSTSSPLSRGEAAPEDRRLRDAVHAVISRHPAFGPGSEPVRPQEPATRPAVSQPERRS
jgi:hypothetical protein